MEATHSNQGGHTMTASRSEQHGTYTLESYDGGRGPQDKGDLIGPPGSLGAEWPTGFAGTGWCIRDDSGAVVHAHAWRADCLTWLEREQRIGGARVSGDVDEARYGTRKEGVVSGEDRASRSGAAAPRCAVCGGPDADGNGCEFCPKVDASPTAAYHVCVFCGHVETREPDIEPPRECENCRAHYTSLVAFDDIDTAEALSEAITREKA
jgi:hypothetical protein